MSSTKRPVLTRAQTTGTQTQTALLGALTAFYKVPQRQVSNPLRKNDGRNDENARLQQTVPSVKIHKNGGQEGIRTNKDEGDTRISSAGFVNIQHAKSNAAVTGVLHTRFRPTSDVLEGDSGVAQQSTTAMQPRTGSAPALSVGITAASTTSALIERIERKITPAQSSNGNNPPPPATYQDIGLRFRLGTRSAPSSNRPSLVQRVSEDSTMLESRSSSLASVDRRTRASSGDENINNTTRPPMNRNDSQTDSDMTMHSENEATVYEILNDDVNDEILARNKSYTRQSISQSNTGEKDKLNVPYMQQSAASSISSIHATYNAMYPRRIAAVKTGESLANAIVASSIASTRSISPTKLPPPSKFADFSRSLSRKRSHRSLFRRTPSPGQVMQAKNNISPPPMLTLRKTLRKSPESGDEEDPTDDPYWKHKRKRHINKHANKYHEGDRKRWRNVVTESERSRYEGLWAANKGLLLLPSTSSSFNSSSSTTIPPTQSSAATVITSMTVATDPRADRVHAFIIRDLWLRSRLHPRVLEEIWNLVDTRQDGALSREEFVVGIWLIDQKLRGRKLPVKISESTWDSVRFLKGIRIRPAKPARLSSTVR